MTKTSERYACYEDPVYKVAIYRRYFLTERNFSNILLFHEQKFLSFLFFFLDFCNCDQFVLYSMLQTYAISRKEAIAR